MKNLCKVIVIAFFICTPGLFSQVKVGVGIGLKPISYGENNASITSGGIGSFYIPIQFPFGLKLEPEFAVYSSHSESSSKESSYNEDIDIVSYAIRGSYNFKVDSSLFYNTGIRVGWSKSNHDYWERNTIYTVDVYHLSNKFTYYTIGISFGSEYFLYKNFSLGAEIQLNYNFAGKPKNESEFYTFSKYSYGTSGIVFVRFYFN